MKSFLPKLSILFFSLIFIAPGFLQAQQKTAFDQLRSVNSNWQGQADMDPVLASLPAKDLTEQELLQFHLQKTEELLRKRNPKGLTAQQRKNRETNLNTLHAYRLRGIFPVNDKHLGRQPYFIDNFNTYCAAGYLMQQSGADKMARDINRTQNYNFLIDITHPDLMNWVYNSGLSLDELALIQPAYDGDWGCAITELHYNNAGTDVNEYIEVHQSNYHVLPGNHHFTSIRFYDQLNVLYKTLLIAEMQSFNEPGDNIFYHYQFPANESLADLGKIEILNSASEPLFIFYYDASGVTQEERNPSNPNLILRTRQFNVIEDNSTPTGNSLTFCGDFFFTTGPNMWQPSINPATIGILNPCVILAVSLIDFTYINSGKTVQLKWATSSESNSEQFIIERSSDGTNFSPIGNIKAAGNSNSITHYSFIDNDPGYLNHYRLKQVDRNGQFKYSLILFVKFTQAVPLVIINNPVSTTLSIRVDPAAANSNIVVYDLYGRKMMQLKARAGKQDIDVEAFPSGKYIIQLQASDGKVYNQAFIKK